LILKVLIVKVTEVCFRFMSRDKLSKDDLPDSIQDNVEAALKKTGVSWDQLSESQKKQIIGGGNKAHKIYREHS